MADAASFTGAGAGDLMPGRRVVLAEVSSTTVDESAWQRIDVPRSCVLRPASGSRLVRYYSGTPNEQTLNYGLQYNAWDGVCYMTRPGVWWVNVPTDGTPGNVNFTLLDVQSAALASAIAAGTTTGTSVQTITMSAPTENADVDTASEALVAASATRKFLYLRNKSTAGQVISLAFGSDAAVAGRGITLTPGEWVSFQDDGIAPNAVNVISDALNASVAIQTGG